MSGVRLRAVILGCGSSTGAPRIGGDWGACDPSEPKNRRLRSSLLVERFGGGGVAADAKTSVLIDTAPDLRQQLLAAEVKRLDAVLYTHDHADQTHGIDDLRVLAQNQKSRIDVRMDAATAESLTTRFAYAFRQKPGSPYPPILAARTDLEPLVEGVIDGPGGRIRYLPLDQAHGQIRSLGFRFSGLAYSNDVSDLPEASLEALEGLDVWIVDALRYRPHPTHANVEQALRWIDRLKPKRAILTNLHIDLDYHTLVRELPTGVEPAFDGMTIEIALDDPTAWRPSGRTITTT